jgi:hypothetical protein
MTKTTKICSDLNYINLGGVGFTVAEELERRRVHILDLATVMTSKDIKVRLKINIIKIDKDEDGNYYCHAAYRHLTKGQLAKLKDIAILFALSVRIKAVVVRPP